MRAFFMFFALRDAWRWLRRKGVLGLVLLLVKWLVAIAVAVLGFAPAAIGLAVGFLVMSFAFGYRAACLALTTLADWLDPPQ